jgi:hypothetical protein
VVVAFDRIGSYSQPVAKAALIVLLCTISAIAFAAKTSHAPAVLLSTLSSDPDLKQMALEEEPSILAMIRVR